MNAQQEHDPSLILIRAVKNMIFTALILGVIHIMVSTVAFMMNAVTVPVNNLNNSPQGDDIPSHIDITLFTDHGAPAFSLPDFNIKQKITGFISFVKSIITTTIDTLKSITIALINFAKFIGIYYKNQNELFKLLQIAIVLFVFNLKQKFKLTYQGCA